MLAIFRCRKITIAAVNGHAVGVGFSGLQLPCDFRFAWVGAKLALPFVRRGITAECASLSFFSNGTVRRVIPTWLQRPQAIYCRAFLAIRAL